MNINDILTKVAIDCKNKNLLNNEVYYEIFIKMKEAFYNIGSYYYEDSLEKADCILFYNNDNGKIGYRKTYAIKDGIIFNQFGFKKYTNEVVPYEGDPEILKEILKEFVINFMGDNIMTVESTVPGAGSPEINLGSKNMIKNTVEKMIETNKVSAVRTAKMELGKSANKLVLDKLKPQLPMIVRGYAESPIAELVVGNIVAGLLIQFAPNNKKANILSDAMIAAGVQVAVEQFDIPGLVKELLANVDITGLEDD